MFTGICVYLPQVTLTQDKGGGVLQLQDVVIRGETEVMRAGDRNRDPGLGGMGPPDGAGFPPVSSRWGFLRVAGSSGIDPARTVG